MKKFFGLLILICVLVAFFGYRSIHSKQGSADVVTTRTISSGKSVKEIAVELKSAGVIHSDTMLVRYLVWKKLDTKLQHGDIAFSSPFTIVHAARELTTAQAQAEREITILPGWDLRDIAEYFAAEGIASEETFFAVVGTPLVNGAGLYDIHTHEAFADVPADRNLEGYLRPDTFRIFLSASLEDIVEKLVSAREDQITDTMLADIKAQGKTVHDIMTMASILEREVRTPEDRRLVADLFWRRYDIGMALQADSTVHYIVGTDDSVFTTAADRAIDSPWNTYKYPGLPPGPISMPSLDSIKAAIYPEANTYWYFLTTLDTGEVKYAETLDQHNENVYRYLRN